METGSIVRTFDIQRDFGYLAYALGEGWQGADLHRQEIQVGRLPLDGSPSSMLMDFAPDEIFGFDWSPDGTELVIARGQWNEDVVLIRDTTRK